MRPSGRVDRWTRRRESPASHRSTAPDDRPSTAPDDRPAPGEEYNPGPPRPPRQAASVILLRGGRGDAGGAAREAHAGGALHGRRVGVSRRRGRRRGGRRRRRPPRRRRSASCARRPNIALDDPAALVKFSRWITPAEVKIRFDTHFFLAPLPDGQEPQSRRRGVRGSGLVHAAGGPGRASERARSRSCSRRSSTWSSCATSPPSTSCWPTPASSDVQPVQPRVLVEGEVARSAARRSGYCRGERRRSDVSLGPAGRRSRG